MWAQSLRNQVISDAKGEDHIHENERILVEVSHKFTPEELSLLLQRYVASFLLHPLLSFVIYFLIF